MLQPRVQPRLTKSFVLQWAESLLPKFQEAIADVPPEAGFGGIWESEMFLFYAAVFPHTPKQILESGRARGKSTLMLARCFPETRIVSVELDLDSASAPVAETKLKSYLNVELLYGDSRKILPQRVQTGDAVLIDGPKGFRALELALQIVRTAQPCALFLHDFPPNAPWRKFVERYWPAAFFSDEASFDRFRLLDQARDPRDPAQTLHGRRYGVFACLPPELAPSYSRLRFNRLIAHFAK